MKPARLLLAVLFALAPPASARAQLVPAVDVGVVSLGYSGTARAAALSITPTLRFAGASSLFAGSVTFSQFDGGEWSTQGAVAGSHFTPAWRSVRGELSASASLIAHRTLFRAGDAIARARVHAHGAQLGAWMGGGAGWGRHADAWHPLSLAEAGLWSEHGRLRIGASVTSRSVAVADSFVNSSGVFARYRRRGTHVDAIASVAWRANRFELGLLTGARDGGRVAGNARWGIVSATYRLTDWLQVIAEAGGEPEIVAQRLPEGRFGLLAIRFSPWRAATSSLSSTTASSTVSRDFVFGAEDASAQMLRIEEPRARRVELRADFTDWKPVSLRRGAGGSWEFPLDLAPGVYRVSIRIDGGEWGAPPGVPAVEDEFGSMVGLVVVR